MVGGRIIEITPVTLAETGKHVVRLWCVDTRYSRDEVCVYVEDFDRASGPQLGDEVWWQGMKVFYDEDRKHLAKVGYSFRPRSEDAP